MRTFFLIEQHTCRRPLLDALTALYPQVSKFHVRSTPTCLQLKLVFRSKQWESRTFIDHSFVSTAEPRCRCSYSCLRMTLLPVVAPMTRPMGGVLNLIFSVAHSNGTTPALPYRTSGLALASDPNVACFCRRCRTVANLYTFLLPSLLPPSVFAGCKLPLCPRKVLVGSKAGLNAASSAVSSRPPRVWWRLYR